MNKIKTAVIGVGYLGKFHAQKYANLENSQLIAVVDASQMTASEIAKQYSVEALTDYRQLLGKVDAVSIAAPTSLHHQIAKDFLNHGTHVLIEKPITVTVEQADELLALARQKDLLIQVGFLERFNAAVLELDKVLTKPLFIESHRLAPFNPRATDVNVVLDLMIHDIDIILNIVKSELKSISASGAPVLTNSTDIVNARLEFENGCVANVTASRVSMKNERKMRLFQQDSCVTIDFQNRALNLYQKGEECDENGIPKIIANEQTFDNNDALQTEIIAFLNSIETQSPTLVTGEDGRRALDTAIKISQLLSE
ncbi:Gfo/Idh/MocA family protein [Aliikangiella coralliicola]|uniref:Gfo/Idh/MocA family oxidoreductase n=1 Tax=Aliikangiella coralliicola TaxID=2592383 RepID=A0A545UAY7_9GAMM|nr:Gfo/Idh/MocA family oxidoreductase [Aliikangiella coralliicola]TQV86629.1 Gfo/Idh/MocA family oxidoreductase [Aliikangiella coralliicola]